MSEVEIGPYANLSVCQQSLGGKYGLGKAEKICSMLQKQTIGRAKNLRANYFGSEKDLETFLDSKSIMEFDKNGDLYLKNFLFNKEISANYWGVNYDLVEENLPTVIGKPMVEYRNTGLEPPERDDFGEIGRILGELDHPPMDDADLNHTLQMQEPYRVGTYSEYVQHPNDGSYWALGTVHDAGVKKAFQEDPDLPFFTSSAIRSVGTHYIGTPVDRWIFLHSAFVDRPAFGVRNAAVKAQCTGDANTCLTHLRRASINLAASKGIDMNKGCPFCTYAATKEIGHNIRNLGLEDIGKPVKGHGSLISSYLTKTSSINTDKKVSANATTQQDANTGSPTAQNAVVDTSAAQNSKSEYTTTSTTTTNAPTLTPEARLMEEIKENEKLKAAIKERDEAIAKLDGKVKLQTTFSEDLNKEVANLKAWREQKEKQEESDKIAFYVNNSQAYGELSEAERKAKIELFLKLGAKAEDVKQMLGAPEAKILKTQSTGPAPTAASGPQGPQTHMGMNAVASIQEHTTYNDGTEYGGGSNRTAAVRDDIDGQRDGFAVFQGLRDSYFKRGSRSEV